MELFTKKHFAELSQVHGKHCVSIYIPIGHQTDGSEDREKNKIHFKNQLKEAARQLKFFGMAESEVEQYLEPLRKLEYDSEFWIIHSDGLALFYMGDEIKSFPIPMRVEPVTYVNDHYYVKPLSNLTHGAQRHFILNLSLQNTRLFDATAQGILEISIDNHLPRELRDSVGYELEEEHLQQRSGQGEKGESDGMFHGHGGGNENEKKEEALQYFRDIDEGLKEFLNEENVPLVVACVGYLFPLYKEANSYKHLVNKPLEGNYDNANKSELKEKAWEIVKDIFDHDHAEARDRFKALVNQGKSSSDPAKVIPASVTGRTDELYIKKGEQLWGRYNQKDRQIDTHEVRRMGDSDLYNLAASHTINQGGKVFLVDEDEIPLEHSEINAIFRYDYSS
jgi:hypothetical protein